MSTLTERYGGPKATRMTKTGRKLFDEEEFQTAYHVQHSRSILHHGARHNLLQEAPQAFARYPMAAELRWTITIEHSILRDTDFIEFFGS